MSTISTIIVFSLIGITVLFVLASSVGLWIKVKKKKQTIRIDGKSKSELVNRYREIMEANKPTISEIPVSHGNRRLGIGTPKNPVGQKKWRRWMRQVPQMRNKFCK